MKPEILFYLSFILYCRRKRIFREVPAHSLLTEGPFDWVLVVLAAVGERMAYLACSEFFLWIYDTEIREERKSESKAANKPGKKSPYLEHRCSQVQFGTLGKSLCFFVNEIPHFSEKCRTIGSSGIARLLHWNQTALSCGGKQLKNRRLWKTNPFGNQMHPPRGENDGTIVWKTLLSDKQRPALW